MFDYIQKFLVEALKALFKGLVDCSYIICLVTACLSILLYVGGCKKAGKAISISIIIYFLLSALAGEIK